MAIPQTNMAQKRSGLNPLSYMGVESTTPPQLMIQDYLPTANDKENISIGAIWVYNDRSTIPWYPHVFMLTSLAGGRAVWTPLGAGTGEFSYVLADDGNYAYPTSDGQLSILGDGVSIATSAPVGTPNTLKITYTGALPAGYFQTSTGTATPDPVSGTLKLYGASNIYTYTTTSGVPPITDTVVTALNNDVVLSGFMKIGTTLTVDSYATHPGILVSDNAGVVTTVTPTVDSTCPVYNTGTGLITWQAFSGGGGAGSFVTDSGTAVPDGTGKLNVIGQNCIVTDGGTANTVKVGVSEVAIPVGEAPVIVGMGVGTPSQWGSITADNGNTLVYSGGKIIIRGGGTSAGSGLTDMDVDDGTVHISIVPPLNMINLYGATNQIVTHAAATSEIEIQISPTLSLPGTLTIPAMTTAGVLTNNASGLISSSAGASDGQVLTWTSGAPVWAASAVGTGVTTLKSDSGTATVNLPGKPVGQLQVIGGLNIGTTAGTDTLTINLDTSVLLPATTADSFNGVIGIGTALIADRFISALGTGNCFVGKGSGVLTGLVTANAKYNTSLGGNSMNALVGTTSANATRNTGLGYNSAGSLTEGTDNTFCGYGSGDGTVTTNQNCAYGSYSLSGVLTGNDNCAYGYKSMYVATSAVGNSVYGSGAAIDLTTGDNNCIFGFNSAAALTSGSNNVIIGHTALDAATNATYNTIVGNLAGTSIVASGATANSIVGYGCLASVADAGSGLSSYNTALGHEVGVHMLSANYVIAIGHDAAHGGSASAITSSHSSIFLGSIGLSSGIAATDPDHSIFIGNHGTGNAQQDACYIAGINGATAASTAKLVTIDANHKLAPVAGTMSAGSIMMGGTTAPTWGTITSTGGSIAITTSTPGTINLEQDSTYCFSAYLTVTQANVIGNGTTEYIFGTTSALSEEVDDGGNFYPGSGSGTPAKYTAPYTGFYNFCISIQYSYTLPAPVTISRDPIYIKIYNSGGTLYRTYAFDYVLPTAAGTYSLNGQYTVFCKMTAGQYAQFSVSASVSTSNIVSIGSGAGNTYIAGFLVGKL